MIESCALGLDLGSSYVKAVYLDSRNRLRRRVKPTGYNYQRTLNKLLAEFPEHNGPVGITGYGRYEWPGDVRKTEIACLARGLQHYGVSDATLVDIGGQDSKVLIIRGGKVKNHFLNRRCAAGTGSYLEFIAHRLDIPCREMNSVAQETETFYPINSFCTVFTSTELLDCMNKKIPFPELIRGLYVSIVHRIREMAPLEPPLYLSGGVVAHHPVILEVFQQILEMEVKRPPYPQYLAALGAALYAKEGRR